MAYEDVLRSLRIKGVLDIGGALTVGGSFTFGDAAVDTLILKGRMATGTAAGSAIDIDATTYQYSEGMELRYTISDWSDTYTITEFKGLYLRVQNNEANASGSIYGAQIFGVANAVNTQSVWGALFYGYAKGSAGITIDRLYGIQAEISWDAGGSSDTISTEATPILSKVTSGTVGDYTKIHGMIIRMGDMNGGSRLYGNGILIEDDSDMSGTSTLTTGLNITIGCTTGIEIGGAVTTGINFSSTMTSGISFSGATLAPGSAGGVSSFALEIGSRTTELDITFAGGAGVENFEPVQMKCNFIGANPASLSKVNMIYQQLTHTTTDMDNLRLKCADFTISVNKHVKDVYAYQGEILFGAGTVTAGGEVAVLGLVLDAAAGTLTNSSWRGINVTLRGSATPSNSQGIFIHAQTGATVDDGIRIIASGTMRHAIRIGEPEYDDTPTHLFAFPAEGTSPISDTTNVVFNTDPVKISVLVGGTQYYLLAAKDFS